MSKLQEMYDGWRNLLVPSEEMEKIVEPIAARRLAICEACPFHSMYHKTIRFDKHCTLCGCTLSAKTRSLASSCPDNPPRWLPEVIHKEE